MAKIVVKNGKIVVKDGQILVTDSGEEVVLIPGPTGLAVSSITDDGATFSWNALAGATSYVVELKPEAASNYVAVGSVTTTSLAATGLAGGTPYLWRVRATVDGETSLYSQGPNFSTTGNVSPNEPKLYKPLPFYEELEVLATLSEISLSFKDGVKFGPSVSIDLEEYDGSNWSLSKSFGAGDRSIIGHWDHTVLLSNVVVQQDKSYRLIISDGSIQDLLSSENYSGLSGTDYTFNITKSSYNEVYMAPAPLGNDSNSGLSAGSPKRTLEGAWSISGADTRINLAAGIYRQVDVTLSAKVNQRNPIIIKGAGEANTFIRGSEELTGWTNVSGNVWKTSLNASGFESQACWHNGVHLTQIGVTSIYHTGGGGSEQYLTPQGTDENDLIQGSFYHKASTNEIFVWLSDNSDPNASLMEASRATWVLETRDVQGLVVQDLTIEHTGNDNRGVNGCIKPGPRQKYSNCRVRYSVFQNFRITSGRPYLQVENCEISWAGNVGLDANNGSVSQGTQRNYFLFRNNIVHNNNYRNFYYAWHSGGFKMIPGMFHVVVDTNEFYENHGPNIWFDHPMGENVVEGNKVTGHTDPTKLGQGIFYEVSENLLGSWGCVIRNNLVLKTHRQGIYISASQEVEVYNNNVLESWTPMVAHGMPRSDTNKTPPIVYSLRNNNIYNNIFENILGATGSYGVIYTGNDDNGDPSINNFLDNNFYHTADPGSSPNPTLAITSTGDYGATDSAVGSGSSACAKGYECNGLSGDALFVDRDNGDYSLQSGSPAAGKGYLG